MRFKFHTLVDVTKTDARFSKADPLWHQQQNYLTFLQTSSLRVNATLENLREETRPVSGLGFGSAYKGEHRVWSGEVTIEHENSLTVEMLEGDFHLVPIINKLNETVNFKDSVFDSKSKQSKNIVFMINNNS